MKKEILSVHGMNCMNCSGKVERGVSALAGVSQVDVDLKGKSVSVNFDEAQVEMAAIKDVIQGLGFTVEETTVPKGSLMDKLLKRGGGS